MSFLTHLNVTERILFHRRSNEHKKYNEKEKTKRKLKRPQHIHSLLSRFFLQPPLIEVLSGLLRAAYWPLVFLFSSFSGLFWPGSFFPGFRIWIPKRCKGVHCVDLGESFPTSIYLQKSASIQPRTSPSKLGGKFNSLFTSLLRCAAREARAREAPGAPREKPPGRGARTLVEKFDIEPFSDFSAK